MCLESGLTRPKNSINVAVKNFADFGVSVALFWAFGYALMFGVSNSGLLGFNDFFVSAESQPKLASFFLFEAMFCGTATTIVSGAVAERMKFKAYLLVTCIASGLIYPLFGHWAWNGINLGSFNGWLGQLGFVDFAGSTIVHSIGGWIALAALLVIGPRQGRFDSQNGSRKFHGANLQLSVMGAMLLWLGWFGFNGGSVLSLNDRVPGIIVHTVIAGVAGAIASGLISWQRRKVPEVELLINGSIAGLVSITGSCHAITTPQAALIGAIGAVFMMLTKYLLERLRIDDAVDAVAVHAGAGVWGTLAVALFGNPQLLHGNLSKTSQILVQLLGIVVAFICAFGLTWILLFSINRFFGLRVSPADEDLGLNISEHHAQTEVYDLFRVMADHAKKQDLSLRVPVDPFTEVGRIAVRYNQVMDSLEDAITRTEAIIKTATDAIITFSHSTWEILTANPSAEDIFGYSKSKLIGSSIVKLLELPTEDVTEQKLLIENYLKSGRHQVVGRRENGTTFALEITVTQATLNHSCFYTGTFRDISDRKRAEEALQQAAQTLQTSLELQQKNRQLEDTLRELKYTQAQLIHSEKMSSLGHLVAGVAHEINNPVNFIYGNLTYAGEYVRDLLHMLKIYRRELPEPSPEMAEEMESLDLDFIQDDFPKIVQSMKEGANRIRDIVKSLRTFSRLDESELKFVDIHEGIDSTLMLLERHLQPTLTRPGIEIIKEYGQLPKVECYAGQLNQVFMNLLSNAIDALDMGGDRANGNGCAPESRYHKFANGNWRSPIVQPVVPTIYIDTEVISEKHISIRIADNGPGMTEDVKTKIFDPFFTTKPVGKGTGLGLSVSYQVVTDKHGGKLTCNSAPNKGSEFIIEIPLEQPLSINACERYAIGSES